jgi:hypothetical protein
MKPPRISGPPIPSHFQPTTVPLIIVSMATVSSVTRSDSNSRAGWKPSPIAKVPIKSRIRLPMIRAVQRTTVNR